MNIIHKKRGKAYKISYAFADGIFGKYLVASTEIGICLISFVLEEHTTLEELKSRFPGCELVEEKVKIHTEAEGVLNYKECSTSLNLHVFGTDFQVAVWKELVHIPYSKTSNYAQIAKNIGHPRAVRAVGTAIGANPIAVIIPCHRVFRSDGGMGGYRWGLEKKRMINEYEQNSSRIVKS